MVSMAQQCCIPPEEGDLGVQHVVQVRNVLTLPRRLLCHFDNLHHLVWSEQLHQCFPTHFVYLCQTGLMAGLELLVGLVRKVRFHIKTCAGSSSDKHQQPNNEPVDSETYLEKLFGSLLIHPQRFPDTVLVSVENKHSCGSDQISRAHQ